MDLQNIGEFHCAVCFELFGENLKCPRILTCGHSFCQSCLESLLVQSPTCPNCKHGIQFPNVASIPVNYIVKSLVSRFNVNIPVYLNEQSNTELSACLNKEFKDESMDSLSLKKEISSHKLPYEGYCRDHNNYQQLRCMDCKCWVCGICVVLNHKLCRTLLVAEALNEMKQEVSQNIAAEIEEQHSQNKNLDKYLNDLENKMSSLKNEIKKLQLDLRSKIETLKSFGKNVEKLQLLKSERKKYCSKVKLLETSVVASVNDDQFLKIKCKLNEFLEQSRKLLEDLTIPRRWYGLLTLQVLRDWCQEGSVYASRPQNGSTQYGKVDVKGDRVWVHCFKSRRSNETDVIISVEDGTSVLTDVVIATDALTPRAMNFLLLCSGVKGRSYEGEELCFFGGCIGTPPNKEGAVVRGIKDGGVYEAPCKKGIVLGFKAENTNRLSRFFISLHDEPTAKFPNKFGFVEKGIDVCEIIFNNKQIFIIKHCGLVI